LKYAVTALGTGPVSHGSTNFADVAGDGIELHTGIGPAILQQLFLRHQALSMLHEIHEHLVGLGLELDELSCPVQFAPICVKHTIRTGVSHVLPLLCA
jgi:hypothetical protein